MLFHVSFTLKQRVCCMCVFGVVRIQTADDRKRVPIEDPMEKKRDNMVKEIRN
jgi:hypothetical protein